MASTSSQMESYSSNRRWTHDVFLSFRGEDTRYSFTDHLYTALVQRGIKTFRDDKLKRGEKISPELLKAIEESKFSIIVFSENYAGSKWCLDELAKIMECRQEIGQIVLPIFYHVDPSDVRNQSGSFARAFADYEENWKGKVQRWRKALNEAGHLSGWHLQLAGYESKVIEQIIKEILPKLNHKLLYVGKNIIGMDYHLEELKPLMNINVNDVRMIGIYGIGGIGKTTIAKALYNEILHKFEGSSFLADVREQSTNNVGLLKLQQQLLNDALAGKYKKKLNSIHEGTNVIREKLRSKKVFIILDDVDKRRQLDYLVGECKWFGSGSRIIITTRYKNLLPIDGAHQSYEPKKLNDEEAIKLLSLYAFKQNIPREDYKSLLDTVVKYAKGLPLALIVLGSTLSSKRGIHEWESELYKLKKEPNMEIYDVLKISFDGLSRIQKQVFLDVACFFKGKDKDFVSRVLDDAKGEIDNLCERCLITILDNKIHMHDLILQMGREIVREECPNEPGEQSRLWDLDDVSSVLARNTGRKVEGLFLDMSTSKGISFTTEAFQKMNRLRLLKVHQDAKFDDMVKNDRDVCLPPIYLPKDFKFPSFELRYLHWDGYPLKSLPSDFLPKNLIELSLRSSNIIRLWKGNKLLTRLKVMNLNYAQHLIELPNVSTMPYLEILTIEGCTSLKSLPRDIDKLQCLQILSCGNCSKLDHFPEIKENMTNLRKLYLHGTAIEKLPSSIEHFKEIEYINLARCKNLMRLPKSICNFRFLRSLNVNGCSKLHKLPEDLDSLKGLEELYSGWISSEMSWLSGLSSLRVLHLNYSISSPQALDHYSMEELHSKIFDRMNRKIPNLSSLQALDLSGSDICFLPDGISQLCKLKFLGLSHCRSLVAISKLASSSLRILDAHNCNYWQIDFSWMFNCFKSEVQDSGSKGSQLDIQFAQCGFIGKGISVVIPEMPQWIRYQKMGNEVRIELPINWYDDVDFLGFALWALYAPPASEDESANKFEEASAFSCQLGCYLSVCGDQFRDMDCLKFYSDCKCYCDGVSSQVWMTFYPQIAIPEKYRANRWRQFKALFFGHYGYGTGRFKVEKCGIHLIYDQDHQQNHPLMIHNKELLEGKGGICSDCEQNEKFQEMLCLGGTAINELSTIECLSGLDSLCLRNCKNLECLSSDIFMLKSLGTLSCSGCSNLTNFPEIPENVENLRRLFLDGTSIKELPSSIEHLNKLEFLGLSHCKNLAKLPDSIYNLSSLIFLNVRYCSELHNLPKNLGMPQCPSQLSVARLDPVSCQLPSSVGSCPLTVLDFSYCNLVEEGFPSEICRLSSLQMLWLRGNPFSNIPTAINQLPNLRILDLSHCKMMVQIPELPSSLRVIDVHDCTSLETSLSPSSLLGSSLFKCFKSQIQDLECRISSPKEILEFFNFSPGISIVIPGSTGIPEWIRHQKKGSTVATKLPRNWYENNDFLGVALCSVHVPLDDESEDEDRLEMKETWSLECEMTFNGHNFQLVDNLRYRCWCECKYDDAASKQVWVIYYPKIAIKKEYHSNAWKQLHASFSGYLRGGALKVEECGIHLIYAEEYKQKPPTVLQASSCDGSMDDHRSAVGHTDIHAEISCNNTEGLSNHPPMAQNDDDNALGFQGDEHNHMPRLLELLCNFVEWICCARH